MQGLARLVYSVLIGHFGSRELLGQTNTSLSLSVLDQPAVGGPASAAGTRFVAARADARTTLRGPRSSRGTSRSARTRISLVLPDDGGPRRVPVPRLQPGAHHRHRGAGVRLLDVQHASRHPVRLRCVSGTWPSGTPSPVRSPSSPSAVVLALDLTVLTLLPLALGYAVFAVVSWPARVGRPGRPGAAPPDRPVRAVRGGERAGQRWAAPALADRRPLLRRRRRRPATSPRRSRSRPRPRCSSVALSTVLVPATRRGRRPGRPWRGARPERRHRAPPHRDLRRAVRRAGHRQPAGHRGGLGLRSTPRLPGSSRCMLVAVMLTSIALGAATTLQSTRVRGPRAVAVRQPRRPPREPGRVAGPRPALRHGGRGAGLPHRVRARRRSACWRPSGGSSGTTGSTSRPSSSAAPRSCWCSPQLARGVEGAAGAAGPARRRDGVRGGLAGCSTGTRSRPCGRPSAGAGPPRPAPRLVGCRRP